MEDQIAISLLKQGNLNGLEALVNRYQAKAVRAAYLITHDRAMAEDVAQIRKNREERRKKMMMQKQG